MRGKEMSDNLRTISWLEGKAATYREAAQSNRLEANKWDSEAANYEARAEFMRQVDEARKSVAK